MNFPYMAFPGQVRYVLFVWVEAAFERTDINMTLKQW
jgi:hypothetical protein